MMTTDDILAINLVPPPLQKPLPSDFRIGLVAAGRIVHSGVMPAYRSVGIQPVAAADPDPDAREALQHIWGVSRVFSSYKDMLNEVELDVVDVNLRWDVGLSSTRVEVVSLAADRGVHVLIAKPLAETWQQCIQMVEAAERAGIILAVDQNTRFAPTFYGCRALIEAGALGDLLSGSINYHSALGRQHTNAFRPVHDVCVHGVDVLLSWFEEEPEEVYAYWTRRVDGIGSIVSATMAFSRGRCGSLLYDFATRHRRQFECIVVGESATVDGLQDQELPPPSRMLRSTLRYGPHEPRGAAVELPLQHTMSPQSYLATRADLLQSIERGSLPWVNGRSYLRTMRVLLAIVQATSFGGGGGLVKMADFDPSRVSQVVAR